MKYCYVYFVISCLSVSLYAADKPQLTVQHVAIAHTSLKQKVEDLDKQIAACITEEGAKELVRKNCVSSEEFIKELRSIKDLVEGIVACTQEKCARSVEGGSGEEISAFKKRLKELETRLHECEEDCFTEDDHLFITRAELDEALDDERLKREALEQKFALLCQYLKIDPSALDALQVSDA